MSKTEIQRDYATAARRGIIRDASCLHDSLLYTMINRAGFAVKDIKRNLIEVSHSQTRLMLTLCAAALVGFAFAAGAFNLKNANNEISTMHEATKLSMPVQKSDNSYEHQLTSMLDRSSAILNKAALQLESTRKKDPVSFDNCLSKLVSATECPNVYKRIEAAKKDIVTAVGVLNYVERNYDSAAITGVDFSLEFLNKSEETRQYVVDLNKKYVGLFGNQTFSSPEFD